MKPESIENFCEMAIYTEIVNYAILSCKCDKHPLKALFKIEFDIMPHGNQQGNEVRSVLSQKQA